MSAHSQSSLARQFEHFIKTDNRKGQVDTSQIRDVLKVLYQDKNGKGKHWIITTEPLKVINQTARKVKLLIPTDSGLQQFLRIAKPVEFFKMLLYVCYKPNSSSLVPRPKIKVSKAIDALVSNYLKIKNVSVDLFLPPFFSNLLNELPFLYRDKELMAKGMLMLEVLGKHCKPSLKEINLFFKKNKEDFDETLFNTLIEKNLILMWNDERNEERYSLSQFGLILLFYDIYEKSKKQNPKFLYDEVETLNSAHRYHDADKTMQDGIELGGSMRNKRLKLADRFDKERDTAKKKVIGQKILEAFGPSDEAIDRGIENIISNNQFLFPQVFKLRECLPKFSPFSFVQLFVFLFFRQGDLKYILPKEAQKAYILLKKHEYKQGLYYNNLNDFFEIGKSCVLEWFKEQGINSHPTIGDLQSKDNIGWLDKIENDLDHGEEYLKSNYEDSMKDSPTPLPSQVKEILQRRKGYTKDYVFKLKSIEKIIRLLIKLRNILNRPDIRMQLGFFDETFFEDLTIRSIQNAVTFQFFTLLSAIILEDKWQNVIGKGLLNQYLEWKQDVEADT